MLPLLVQQHVGLIKNTTSQKFVKQSFIAENHKYKFIEQFVEQIPWGHNIFIFTKCMDTNQAIFYIQKTIENNWSRDVLDLQIKSNLYERTGKSINTLLQHYQNHYLI